MILLAGLAGASASEATGSAGAPPRAGPLGRYRVLPGRERAPPPFDVVTFQYGPRSSAPRCPVAWELAAFGADRPAEPPLFRLRATTSRDPLAPAGDSSAPLYFGRWILHAADDETPIEYRDAVTGSVLLPPWTDFARRFLPRPARPSGRTEGLPHTCEYLGHVLTLRQASRAAPWPRWKAPIVLRLDPELLVGTGRTFKDAEGRRLAQRPERQDYTWVTWTRDDYRAMVAAGMNLFGVVPGEREWLRRQPVFWRAGAAGLQYPADLYRSNYTGPVMFLDEPTCRMVGDETVNTTLRYFTDAAALISQRVRVEDRARRFALEREIAGRGISLGDLRIEQWDFASWETRYETAFWQLRGGAAGFVHEGRYDLGEFNERARASTGLDVEFDAEEMLRYIFAHLRGAARHFGKFWGTSLYGQSDPAINPLAVRLAWDLGARYVWFWTSDHDHHLPWNEQLALARVLKEHAASHPRPSLRGPPPLLDRAIVIPAGTFVALESPTARRNPWDLWWVRELDAAKRNPASRRYRRLVRAAVAAARAALDAGEEFDFTIDDGRPITGYRRVQRLEGASDGAGDARADATAGEEASPGGRPAPARSPEEKP